MRKSILVLVFILISSYLFADFYLIPDSNTKKINESELKDKTLNFLIYARNEIFARYGYIFKNPDLNIYFRNMTWYNQKSSEVKLNEFEEYNVNLIKQVEDTRDKNLNEYPKNLPYRYLFNGKPLFYFGINSRENESPGTINFDYGEFILLDNSCFWTFSCKTIPYEYVKQNRLSLMSNIKDACEAIGNSTRIQIYDIDNLNHILHKRTKDEIIIQANPESGNSNGWIYIIEESEDEELVTIFQAKGDLQKITTVNDSLLEVQLSRTKTIDNFPAATGIIQKYIINRQTNKAINLPLSNVKFTYQYEYKCTAKIPVYADAISAFNKNTNASTGYLRNNIRLEICEFYYSPENYDCEDVFKNLKAFWFESIGGNLKGWVNIDDFRYNFKPLYAGG